MKVAAWGSASGPTGSPTTPARFAARPDLPERIVAYNISQAAVCIAHGAPQHKQFMDPRLEVNTEETFERYLTGIRRLWQNDASWERRWGSITTAPTRFRPS